MDIDDDDDFYAPEEPTTTQSAESTSAAYTNISNQPTETRQDEDLEEGEEEDEEAEMEDSDSDIDIITERKDGTKAPPPIQSRYSDIRNIPQRSTSTDTSTKPPLKKEETPKVPSGSGTELPPVSTSTIDVNAIPTYKPVGKPITQINIDQDLPENDKPWRKPGTDLSDYFNYGFDEFTWALYAAKQDNVRGEYSQDAMAQNNKKIMEEMQMMMMGGMPGMPGPGAPGPMAPAMSGMDGMPQDFQAMMQQMMASGMDPSQMDPAAMSAMFSGMQNPGGGGAGQGGQNQNFNGAGNQAQNFGYDQGMGRGGGFGGRGRGGRRNW